VLAINPNDAERYPRDSLEQMRARVRDGDFDGVPYLRDESQEVARAYDAEDDPRRLHTRRKTACCAYRGAPDADYEDPSQDAAYLRGALDAILVAREPEPAQTPPVGCSIKWRPAGEAQRRCAITRAPFEG